MNKGVISSLLAVAASVLLLTSGLIGQDGAPAKGGFGGGKAKEPPPPAGPMGRLPDGHPDMQGYWNTPAPTDIQAKGKGPSMITDPDDGRIPYRPEAAAKAKDIGTNHMADEPELHCFQSGVPHAHWVQFGFQVVQDPKHIVFLWEFMHTVRIIPTDGRPHISPEVKLFMGDPLGHYEGDTLVVDTTNHNHKTWMDYSGNFKPATVTVLEKFTGTDNNTLAYSATVTDPATYTKPWTVSTNYRRQGARFPDGSRDYEQMEFACFEGQRDLNHYTEDKGGKQKNVLNPKQ